MFSNQAGYLAGTLMQAGFTEAQVSALVDVLGNCSAALTHRGPVTLAGPDPTQPDGSPIPPDGNGDGYALNVDPGSTINNLGDTINAGDTYNVAGSTINNTDNSVTNAGSTITNTGVTETYNSTSHIDFDSADVTGGPVGKVMVNASDTLAYLEDQFKDHQSSPAYASSNDFLVKVDTVTNSGDQLVRAYVHAADFSGWDNSHEFYTGWSSSGAPKAYAAGQVKVATTESLQYLGTAFEQADTFASATDLKSYEQTIGSSPNKSVSLFTRFSAVSGWDAAKQQDFINDTGTIKYVTRLAVDPGGTVTTIGGNTEGSESANSGTYTADGTNGCAFYIFSRQGYYDAGDKKLYSYVRLATFDKYGKLYSVGAETRVEIDAPTAC